MNKNRSSFVFIFLIFLLVGHFSFFAQGNKKAAIISVKDSLSEHSGDSTLRDKLVALGFEVTSYRDIDFDSGQVDQADYESNDLIVASESCSASRLRTILRFGFSVPTINMEVESVRNSHHALELITTVSTGNGWLPAEGDNAYKLKILNGEHPLSAGFSTGEVIDLVSDPACIDEDPFARGYLGWIVDDIGLIPIASINEPGGDTSLVIAGIEKETLNVHGDTINARYVQFNVNSFTTTAWTQEAEKLFEAAIDWAMDSPTSVEDQISTTTPLNYSLSQNYPNPFNPTTTITYSIPENGNVTLNIYDVLGNKIIRLENRNKTAGTYSTFFDASDLTSGIYFYTIRANNFVETKKMLLMK
jgi:Secretion system C-terminal sorting domain